MDLTYLKGIAKYIVSAILSLVIVLYIVYHITGGFTPAIETSKALYTTAEETLSATAIIMRNEQIVYSTTKGNVNYLKSDGIKVATGIQVAEIFSSADSESLCSQIIALNKQISLLESSNMSDTERHTDTASTDEKISTDLYDFIDYASRGNMSSSLITQESLLINMNKRRIITKSISGYSDTISMLKEQRESLYNALSSQPASVYANNTGYFYSYVDGYEDIYTSNNISLLTYDDFESFKNEEPDDFSSTGFGYPVGKLVTDYMWYIACEIDLSVLHNFETDHYYDVRFPQNNDATVNMYLYRILYEVDSSSAILIFRATDLPENFSYARNQTVQIVQKTYTGYRIPSSSLHIVSGRQGVYTLKGTKVNFKFVEPIFEYDGYFIVKERGGSAANRADWLAKNDLVITKGKDLYDGKIVQ
ncbi:MAG: hypothetical protein KBT31_06360 [Firmicutes bacterium]|nr:hypothetical protein [Candidatus Colimorpha enterica]